VNQPQRHRTRGLREVDPRTARSYNTKMTNPTAIVTGGSRGIGRAIASALGREKFNVVVNYNSAASAAEEVKTAIEAAGGKAHIVQADISQAGDRGKLVAETLSAFGRIDLLVNNAGVAPDVRADVLEATEASFDRLININLKGPYFLTQLVAREMIKAQQALGLGASGLADHAAPSPKPQAPGPKVINITSISAYTAHTHRGDYGISKAGLAMMTQVYAARLAEFGINVYELRPGIIATDMTGGVKEKYDDLIFNKDLTPIKRWGTPDDVAKAVLAIAKDYFPFSTGEVINVDGGFHFRRL
jgi:NAD(P)-dependent dehydrogenase (short-subunit alcohol dehydrogenase family)